MKKERIIPLIIIIFILALASVFALSNIPKTMTIQGELKDAAGTIVSDGYYNLTFRIYDVYTGGTALWEESHNASVVKSIYTVILGTKTPINVTFNTSYFMGVVVNNDSEMSPRINMTPVPYAYDTSVMQNITILNQSISTTGNFSLGEKITFALGQVIDGLTAAWVKITGSLWVTGGINTTSINTTSLNVSGGNFSVNNSGLFVDVTNNRVGIGTAAPASQLHINSPGLSTTSAGLQINTPFTGANQNNTVLFLSGIMDNNQNLIIGAGNNVVDDYNGAIVFNSESGWRSNIGFYVNDATAQQNATQLLTQTPALWINNDRKIGIGTKAPSQTLTVNGNLTADNIFYSTPIVRYYSINPSTLIPNEDGYDYIINDHFICPSSAAGLAVQGAINLPDGAVIKNITTYFFSNDTYGVTCQVQYLRADFQENWTPIMGVATCDSDGLYNNVTIVPSYATIDNEHYTYNIDLEMSSANVSYCLRNKFLGATIAYTINTPLP